MTKREAEQAVIRAAMRFTEPWGIESNWMRGNHGAIAQLCRAVLRYKRAKKRRPA